MIRTEWLRPIERPLPHPPLTGPAPFASNTSHDLIGSPTVGQTRIREFVRTEWGTLFRKH